MLGKHWDSFFCHSPQYLTWGISVVKIFLPKTLLYINISNQLAPKLPASVKLLMLPLHNLLKVKKLLKMPIADYRNSVLWLATYAKKRELSICSWRWASRRTRDWSHTLSVSHKHYKKLATPFLMWDLFDLQFLVRDLILYRNESGLSTTLHLQLSMQNLLRGSTSSTSYEKAM